MKFVVNSVSDPDGLYKPLPICKRELVEHPINGLVREWVAEINSLKELIEIIKKEKRKNKTSYGYIVNVLSNDLTTITIYDDYME